MCPMVHDLPFEGEHNLDNSSFNSLSTAEYMNVNEKRENCLLLCVKTLLFLKDHVLMFDIICFFTIDSGICNRRFVGFEVGMDHVE